MQLQRLTVVGQGYVGLPLAMRAVEHRDGSVRFSGQLQLGATPSGVYTLRVEVRDGASGVPSMQSAEFGVER